MGLTRTERERIQDSKLKLQAAANALTQVDADKIDDFEGIQECLQNAHNSLDQALKRPDQHLKPH